MRRSALLAAAFALAASTASAQMEPEPNPHDPGAAGANPHGGGGAGGQMYQPPPDLNEDDPKLPAGSVVISILDPDNKPLPGTNVTLGILHQSVAKGESREHKGGAADANGEVPFAGLETGSGVAYRVSVVKDGATFWAMPFQMPLDKGERVQLHVYPVTHDIQQALVVTQLALYAELKDDRIQIQEAVTFYNLGKTAWVPDDLTITLPEGFTAFSAQQGMTDQRVEPVEKVGAKVRGTFGPGQHPIEFRWQLPYDEEATVELDEGMPPNLAVARVMAAASQKMRLVVSGFPEAEPQTDQQGERILITEKQMRRGEPLKKLHVELRDLPVPPPMKYYATGLAALIVVGGLGYAFLARKPGDAGSAKDQRQRLLEELEELERAHRAGDVGPKTYERARRALVDAIARTLPAKA
jgi:hypothetical protein